MPRSTASRLPIKIHWPRNNSGTGISPRGAKYGTTALQPPALPSHGNLPVFPGAMATGEMAAARCTDGVWLVCRAILNQDGAQQSGTKVLTAVGLVLTHDVWCRTRM
eukprot:scaffold27600_cov124-Isochrysis_galbana.AAC.7